MKKIIHTDSQQIFDATYSNLMDVAEEQYTQEIAREDIYFEGRLWIDAGMTYMDVDGELVACDYEGLLWIVQDAMEVTVTDDDSLIYDYKLRWGYIQEEPRYVSAFDREIQYA